MSLPQLFQVLDAIFGHVRRQVAAIDSLHSALAAHFRASSVPTRTRACFEAFFDFLKKEAEQTGARPRGGRATPRGGQSASVGSPPRDRKPAVNGEATGGTPRGGKRRRGLRNSPKAKGAPAGGLFLPSPGPHPSEMVGDLDEDVPILDNPRKSMKRGRRGGKGDRTAGGAGKASPKTEPESLWGEEDEPASAENHFNRSTKRRRERSDLPPGCSGKAGTSRKKRRVKTEANNTFTQQDGSDSSVHSSTPRDDVPLAVAECDESTPEIESNGVHGLDPSGGDPSGGAGPELGGKGWDDEESEQSFDELLTDVDWDLVGMGLRAESGGAGTGGMNHG